MVSGWNTSTPVSNTQSAPTARNCDVSNAPVPWLWWRGGIAPPSLRRPDRQRDAELAGPVEQQGQRLCVREAAAESPPGQDRVGGVELHGTERGAARSWQRQRAG